MVSGVKNSGKTTSVTQTGRQMTGDMGRRSDTGLTGSRPSPGVMCQQGQDWSRGMACVPQKFVRLVGYRDPDARPSSPLPQRPMVAHKKLSPTDTPIG